MQGKFTLFLFFIAGIVAFTACGNDHAPPKTKDITSFVISTNMNSALLEDATVAIDGSNIMVVLPWGVEATNLVPTIEHSGRDISPPPGTPVDLSSPVVYTLTAGNGSTKQYLVTVTRLCQVTFDSGGGSAVTNQAVLEGGKVTEPPIPIRTGYTFGGWYRKPDYLNIWSFGNDTVTTNMTLHAEWTGFGLVQIIGNTGGVYVRGCTSDASGNFYITGNYWGTVDFDIGTGVDQFTSLGVNDVFLMRYNADGSYAWTKVFGGSGNDYVNSVTTDSSGNVFIVGYFNDTVDFDPGPGVDSRTSAGFSDIFVVKFNPDGSYAWTRTMGGTEEDRAYGTAADSAGNVFVCGYYNDTADFDPGAGTDNHTSAGFNDIFVTKLSNDGSYAWTKTMGGSSDDSAQEMVVDTAGNVYITGKFINTLDFNPGAGIDNHTSAGGYDIFLIKLSNDGSYAWTKTMGGTGYDVPNNMAIDTSGNIYITGAFGGSSDFDPGAGVETHTSAGLEDILVVKLDAEGAYIWSRTMGGVSTDIGKGIAIDSNGDVLIAGEFSYEVDFDPGSGTDTHIATNAGIFVTKLGSGGAYIGSRTVAGTSGTMSYSRGVCLDGSGNVISVGSFFGTMDFDPGSGTENRTSATDYDLFILRFPGW